MTKQCRCKIVVCFNLAFKNKIKCFYIAKGEERVKVKIKSDTLFLHKCC